MGEEELNYDEYDNVTDEGVSGLVNDSQQDYSNAQTANYINNIASQKKNGNFLHHQLATEDMIEKLEHFYRGDYTGPDDSGDIVWHKQKDDELVTFNEFGVTSLMEIITKYIDKNTILSYYSEQRIYEIIGDIGDELVLFMLCNYEKMGMTTYAKKTKFRLIITTTVHIIEATFRRALLGRTMEEINQSKVIGQFGDNKPQNVPGSPRRNNFMQRMMGG